MAGMRVEITLSDMTVDGLWDELSKLRAVGWGHSVIDWRTSRSHLGKQITMALSLSSEDSNDEENS